MLLLPSAAWRITVICGRARVADPVACDRLDDVGPERQRHVVARNVRFATWPLEPPLTVTRACSSFTVPTTMSLTMPATEMASSAVTN